MVLEGFEWVVEAFWKVWEAFGLVLVRAFGVVLEALAVVVRFVVVMGMENEPWKNSNRVPVSDDGNDVLSTNKKWAPIAEDRSGDETNPCPTRGFGPCRKWRFHGESPFPFF